jgi:hypothetical protein
MGVETWLLYRSVSLLQCGGWPERNIRLVNVETLCDLGALNVGGIPHSRTLQVARPESGCE